MLTKCEVLKVATNQIRHTSLFFKAEQFQILTANIMHVKELVNLSQQTCIETYPDYFTQEELDLLFGDTILCAQIKDENNHFYIAKYEGRCIGYAKIILEGEEITLDKLYFLKEFQGKGFGRKLLNTCLSYAHDLGVNTMKLFVYDQNIHAINFYLRNGFQLHKDKIPYFKPDGSVTPDYNFLMECPDIVALLVSNTPRL